jgi:hypothetical protein
MIVSGYVVTVICDSRELHEYAYGTAVYTGENKKECLEKARREGWIISVDDNHCLCPVHVKKMDAMYE